MRDALFRCIRSDVDDLASPGIDHKWDDAASGIKQRACIDVEQEVPGPVGGLMYWFTHAKAASDIAHNVDPPVTFDCCPGGRVDLRLIEQIRRCEQAPLVFGAESGLQILALEIYEHRPAPCSANASATARPTLPAAPVTITVLLSVVTSVSISASIVVAPRPARDHLVDPQNFTRLEFGEFTYSLVHGCEVDVGKLQQFVQIAEYKVRFLEVIDAIARSHYPFKRESNAIGGRIIEREHALGIRRGYPRAIYAKAVAL